MAVLLGRLDYIHVRDFSDPLLSQSMQIEAWGGAGMGAHLLDPGSYDGNVAAMAGPLVCYNCGETGHYTMDWSKPPKQRQQQYVRPGGELGEDAGTHT